MKADLSQLANSLASWIEIVTQLKVNMDTRSTKSVMAHFEGQAEPFANILEKQTVDCQKTVLHDLGKVLLEARLPFCWLRVQSWGLKIESHMYVRTWVKC